jgi:hypothetical protein
MADAPPPPPEQDEPEVRQIDPVPDTPAANAVTTPVANEVPASVPFIVIVPVNVGDAVGALPLNVVQSAVARHPARDAEATAQAPSGAVVELVKEIGPVPVTDVTVPGPFAFNCV